jgi:hypothetical protein
MRRLETDLSTALLMAGARGTALTPLGPRRARGLTKVDPAIANVIRRIALHEN